MVLFGCVMFACQEPTEMEIIAENISEEAKITSLTPHVVEFTLPYRYTGEDIHVKDQNGVNINSAYRYNNGWKVDNLKAGGEYTVLFPVVAVPVNRYPDQDVVVYKEFKFTTPTDEEFLRSFTFSVINTLKGNKSYNNELSLSGYVQIDGIPGGFKFFTYSHDGQLISFKNWNRYDNTVHGYVDYCYIDYYKFSSIPYSKKDLEYKIYARCDVDSTSNKLIDTGVRFKIDVTE